MTNENTCDAINVDFLSYLSEREKFLKCENYFAFKNTLFLPCDEGTSKCENEPFSDFAV